MMLVAAIWAAVSQTVAAQPGATPPAAASDDEGDGPEATAALPIKLDDLIEVAVRMSPDLMRARIDRVAAQQKAESEGHVWALTTNLSWTREGKADHIEVPPFQEVASEKTEGDIGLQKKLSTGADFSVKLGMVHTSTEYNITNQLAGQDTAQMGMSPAGQDPQGNQYEFADNTAATLGITFKQPLARGFGSDVTNAAENRANLLATEATLNAQLAAEKMIKELVTAYWDLAYAAYEVEVRQQAVELAKKQEELTHEQMRAGSSPSNAINSVNYEISQREEALLRAKMELEQKSLEMREKAGLDLTKRSIVMQPAEAFDIGKDEFDVDEVLARTKIANHQLADIMLKKKLADIDIALAGDQAKPQLDLNFQGGLTGNSDSAGGALGGISGGDAFNVSVSVNGSFDLTGARGKAKDSAISQKRKLDFERLSLERQIETQVVTAVHTVTAARQRVALSDRAISVAEDNVRSERNNFMVSRTSSFQVMMVQTKLIEARLNRGHAVMEYHQSVAELQYLSGVLLEQYRVNVRPQR